MRSDDKVGAVVVNSFVESGDDLGLSTESARVTIGVGPGEGHGIDEETDVVGFNGTHADIKENVGDFIVKDVWEVSRERVTFVLRKKIRVINSIACETVEGRFRELNRNVLDLIVFAFSHGCVVGKV